jgi:hypothetical protein
MFFPMEDLALLLLVYIMLKLIFDDKSLLHQRCWIFQIGVTSVSSSAQDILRLALIVGQAPNLDVFVIRYDLSMFKFSFVNEEIDLEILLMFTLHDLEDHCFDFSPAVAIKIISAIDLENKIRAACDFATSIS